MRTILLALGVALALLTPTGADHCETYSTSSTELSCVAIPAVGDYYVDEDCGSDPYSIWVYQESNGIAGLQRGDEVVDDTCHGSIQADTIIL